MVEESTDFLYLSSSFTQFFTATAAEFSLVSLYGAMFLDVFFKLVSQYPF